jgi:hypothetical protein
VARRKYLDMKSRLRAHGSVANHRDTTGYRCGLRLAMSANALISFVQVFTAHHTKSEVPRVCVTVIDVNLLQSRNIFTKHLR